MPTVQSHYGPPEPLDPDAITLMLDVLGDCDVVGSIKPITGGNPYPEHVIVLALDLETQRSGPVVVRHLAESRGHRRLAVLRPDTARSLASQLTEAADDAERYLAGDDSLAD